MTDWTLELWRGFISLRVFIERPAEVFKIIAEPEKRLPVGAYLCYCQNYADDLPRDFAYAAWIRSMVSQSMHLNKESALIEIMDRTSINRIELKELPGNFLKHYSVFSKRCNEDIAERLRVNSKEANEALHTQILQSLSARSEFADDVILFGYKLPQTSHQMVQFIQHWNEEWSQQSQIPSSRVVVLFFCERWSNRVPTIEHCLELRNITPNNIHTWFEKLKMRLEPITDGHQDSGEWMNRLIRYREILIQNLCLDEKPHGITYRFFSQKCEEVNYND